MRVAHAVFVAILLLAFTGCADDPGPPPAPPATWDGEITVYGSLRAIFQEDDISAKVRLADLLPNESLYAAGALENLSGEVTIVRGRTFLATPDDEGGAVYRELDADAVDQSATLLVSAEVPGWRAIPTLEPIRLDELGDEVVELARDLGYSRDDRIPFLIEAQVEDLSWHVIDGRRLERGGRSHEEHLEASVRASRSSADATLIGFYSPRDQGVFTHHGTTVHVHAVVFDPLETGHVDDVLIPEGTNLLVPLPGADE